MVQAALALPRWRGTPEVMELSDEVQIKAAQHLVRAKLLCLLAERGEATVTELAGAVAGNRTTIAYHIRVLSLAGLVRVARTRQVRAISERYYSAVARSFVVSGAEAPGDSGVSAMQEFLAEYAGPVPDAEAPTVIRLRLPALRAAQLVRRLNDLINQYGAAQYGADDAIDVGLVCGAYRLAGASSRRP